MNMLISEQEAQAQRTTQGRQKPLLVWKGEVQSVRLGVNEKVELVVFDGALWATIEGDRMDYAIEAGESQRFTGPGLLVIEGLSEMNAGELR